MAGKDQEVAPKLDGLIPSRRKHDLHSAGLDATNAAQTVFDRPQWTLLVDCQRSNPSKALKSKSYTMCNTLVEHHLCNAINVSIILFLNHLLKSTIIA